MYEQYTDKQIVEMLVPKLNKAVPDGHWDECVKRPELNKKFIKAVATIYRSAYLRGHLGRSFIIGEKKQGEWVPATEVLPKEGDKVKMIDRDTVFLDWFPENGTIGTVISANSQTAFVQWPKGSTSRDDKWNSNLVRLEVFLCE